MKTKHLIYLLIFFGCNHPKNASQQSMKSIGDSTVEKFYVPDSTEQAYIDEQFFYPNIIRLKPNKRWFIHTDSLLIATGLLNPDNRESYYQRVMKMYPKELREIHTMCWQLPELQLQQGGDGGLHTVYTFIESLPTKKHPYYTVNILRDYYDRQSPVVGMRGLRIHKTKKTIEMENTDGEYITLEYWRQHGDHPDDE